MRINARAPRVPRLRALLQAGGCLLALLAGFYLWRYIAFAGKGFASTKAPELALLLFFGPVLGAALPWSIACARRSWYAAGALLLALAPLLSVLNLVICALCFALLENTPATQWAWAGLLTLAWCLPWLGVLQARRPAGHAWT